MPTRQASCQVRRVRRCLLGNRGADCTAPGDPRGPPRGPLWGSLGPHGPGGCLSAPAFGDLCPAASCGFPLSRSAMCLSAVCGSAPLLTLRRKRSQRASWISSHLALLPGAGRLHVKDGCAFHVPSQQATAVNLLMRGRPEISATRRPPRDLPSTLTPRRLG